MRNYVFVAATGGRPKISDSAKRPATAGCPYIAAALACAALVSIASVGSAQQASHLDARWQPWIGCWQPENVQQPGMSPLAPNRGVNTPLVCVIPAASASASSGVDVATVANGKIVARDHIEATGQSYTRSKDGCNGVESADWSADGERVYTRSSYTCTGNLKRTSTGVFAMSPDGEWVDVQGVSTQGGKGVRTLRYRDAGIPAGVPGEIASALRGRSMTVNTARTAAAAPLTSADVIEASHKVDPAVVQAWLVDRGQRFAVNARQLVQLADAGVPSNVTDAMVALSYPKAFAVDSTPSARELSAIGAAGGYGSTGRNLQVYTAPTISPYDYYSPFGYTPYGYSPYGYAPYGSYYSPSPYNAYGSPYSGYASPYNGIYAPPAIIILKGDQQQQAQHPGYAVKGRGYTQTDPRSGTGAVAQPRPSYSPPSPPPSSTEAKPAGSTSGSGRTATPRP